jgi:pimeloyl-ACP methyl ester carboxylesterase
MNLEQENPKTMNDKETRARVSPNMIATGSHELRVPNATLFYRVRGKGPLLLMLAGGHGDADTTDTVCEQLTNQFTVVTYDRRGLSRSTAMTHTTCWQR